MKIGQLEINETTNLFLMKEDNKNTVQGSALYDLLNVNNADWLDNNDIVKKVYEEKYDYYREAEDIMSGDVLNSSNGIFVRYINDFLGKSILTGSKEEFINIFEKNKKNLIKNKKERKILINE